MEINFKKTEEISQIDKKREDSFIDYIICLHLENELVFYVLIIFEISSIHFFLLCSIDIINKYKLFESSIPSYILSLSILWWFFNGFHQNSYIFMGRRSFLKMVIGLIFYGIIFGWQWLLLCVICVPQVWRNFNYFQMWQYRIFLNTDWQVPGDYCNASFF